MNKAAIAVIAAICVGTIIIILGVVLGWAVFPNIVKTQIGESVELKEDTDQYDRFVELPLPFDFKVYMFHVTNKAEINAGKQPIMKEQGPYIYRQTRKKTNITRDEKLNLIDYREYQYFKFDEVKSGKLKANDPITVINPALNGVIQMFEESFPGLLKILNAVTPLVFNTDSIFLESTVDEFLFSGFSICNKTTIDAADIKEKLLANVICTLMYLIPAKNIKPRDKEQDLLFTFLNHKNNNHDGLFTINDGIRYKEELGHIEKWNNDEYLKYWVGNKSECNKVGGRDAVLYPPFMSKDDFKIFNTDICRTIDLKFEKDFSYRDTTAYEFILPKDTFQTPYASEQNECYCLNKTHGINENNGCLKDGVLDLFTCYSAPILLSFPHFLHAHDDYKKSVQGLSPDEEKHRTYVHLEPNTGTPFEGSKRVQFNMFARKVADIDYLKNVKGPYIVPILWLDEHVEISDDLYDVLYDSYISKLPILEGVRWALIAVGIVVVLGTLGVSLWKNRASKETV